MATLRKRQIKLGTFTTHWGSPGAWRHPDVLPNASVTWEFIKELGQTAERGLFDFLFIADSAYITKETIPQFITRAEPMTALSALLAVTRNIGLVGTFTTSFSEPYTTARQLASLDILSGGRAGWNAVTSALEGLGRNHGHEKLYDHETRYEIAREYIEVVRGLWNSWEDDSFVRNKATGEYVDFDKWHTLNHVGKYFKVEGPLNIERSPQGYPVIFQAGASEAGQKLAVTEADAIFAGQFANHDGKYFSDLKRRAVEIGRDPGKLLIFPSIVPIVGDTQEDADAEYERVNALIDTRLSLKVLSRYFSYHDFTQYPLDEPLPDIGDVGKDSFRTWVDYFIKLARDENLTLRQLAARAANPKGDFVGTATQIADRMQHRFENFEIDGFIFEHHLQPKGLRDFVDKVVPILQERGLYRTEYESTTLRGNLGLDFPIHRRYGGR